MEKIKQIKSPFGIAYNVIFTKSYPFISDINIDDNAMLTRSFLISDDLTIIIDVLCRSFPHSFDNYRYNVYLSYRDGSVINSFDLSPVELKNFFVNVYKFYA